MSFTLELQEAPKQKAKSSTDPPVKPGWKDWEWGELLAAVEHGLPGARSAAYARVAADDDAVDKAALRVSIRNAHAEAKKAGLR